MTELRADVLVLGAGMVGVGAALHLQQRGRDVILIDKHERAGEETSYGNAGIIESASVFPYMFPRAMAEIVRYASNRAPQVRYSLADLPLFLPWLLRYYLASQPDRALRGAMSVLPLIRQSLIEHEALIAEAGVPELLRKDGWIKLFRSAKIMDKALGEFERAKQYGVAGDILDPASHGEPALCLPQVVLILELLERVLVVSQQLGEFGLLDVRGKMLDGSTCMLERVQQSLLRWQQSVETVKDVFLLRREDVAAEEAAEFYVQMRGGQQLFALACA